jgi:nucleotide-binding universal stress UspA family protein
MSTLATIVCPVDFSDHSRTALARAYAWARHFRTRLVVVTVVEPVLANAADATYDMNFVRDEILPELREFIESVSITAGSQMAAPEAMVLVGDPPPKSSQSHGERTQT